MRTQRTSDQRVEVQAIHEGDSVLLHCPENVKVMVEAIGGGNITISVDWNQSFKTIEVYDGEGEYLTTIRPKPEDGV